MVLYKTGKMQKKLEVLYLFNSTPSKQHLLYCFSAFIRRHFSILRRTVCGTKRLYLVLYDFKTILIIALHVFIVM